MKRLIFIIILLPVFIIGANADLDSAARDAGIYRVEDSLTDDARDISGKLATRPAPPWDGCGGASSIIW